MTTPTITITGTGKITAVIDGAVFTVETDHMNYQAALQAVRDRAWDKFLDLVDLSRKVRDYVYGNFDIQIKDGVLFCQGQEMHNTLSKRIIDFMMKDLPFVPLMNFMLNLMQNPSKRAVDELYSFLDVGELPITEDGYVLAFKNVRSDYFSIHGNPSIKPMKGRSNEQGQIFNGVGEYIEIRRNQVDENPDQTCSDGLHVASIGYLPHFSDTADGKTVICKIHPKDFIAIPRDYNNQKARVCAYEVVSEYKDDWRSKIERKENGFESPLYSSDGGMYEDDDDCDDCGDDCCDDCSCGYDDSDEPAVVTESHSEVTNSRDFLDGYEDAVSDISKGYYKRYLADDSEDYRKGYEKGWEANKN